MRVKAKWRGREATMRRLNKLLPDTEKELAEAQLDAGNNLALKIENRAPLGETGDYRASIHAARLRDKPGQSIAGLTPTKDKNAVGIFAEFIWRFLEFGTVKMAARPHIMPTYRAERKRIRRKMAGAVNKAVREARKRR